MQAAYLALAALTGLYLATRKNADGTSILDGIRNPRPLVTPTGGYPEYPHEILAQTPNPTVGSNRPYGVSGVSNLGVQPATPFPPTLPSTLAGQNGFWVMPVQSGGPSPEQVGENEASINGLPQGSWSEFQGALGLAAGVLTGGLSAAVAIGSAAISTNGQPQSIGGLINSIMNGNTVNAGGATDWSGVNAEISAQEAALGWNGYDGAVDLADSVAGQLDVGDWGGGDYGGDMQGGGYDGGSGDYGGGDYGGGDYGGAGN